VKNGRGPGVHGLPSSRLDAGVRSWAASFDATLSKPEAAAPGLYMAWRDGGLPDRDGKPRPAYDVWRRYFELPHDS
jgi:hypothetical protein